MTIKDNLVYINTDQIVSIQVTKRVVPKWDKEKHCEVEGEFETLCTPTILLTNGCGVDFKYNMNEHELNNLLEFINPKI